MHSISNLISSITTTTTLHPFNGPLSGTTQVSQYKKGKTNLDFTGARDSEWHWHQLGHIQVCTSLQTDNHTSTPPLSFLQAGCPSCRPTNSVKALKAFDKLYKTTTFVVTNECMLYIGVNKIFNIMVKFMTYRRRWVLARALHVLVLWLLARQGCEGGLIFYLFSYLFYE